MISLEIFNNHQNIIDETSLYSNQEGAMMIKETYNLPKSQEKKIIKQFQRAAKEKDVEKAVERAAINMVESYFNHHPSYNSVSVYYSFKTDGIIIVDGGLFSNSVSFIIEAKKNKNFSENRNHVREVVAQIISYLHEIKEKEPTKYPNVSIGVDNDEIFIIPTIALEKYVDGDYDWSLAASRMHTDKNLMDDLEKDKNIRPVITNINEDFRPSEFCTHLLNMAKEAEYAKIKIGKLSLSDAFTDFRKMILGTNDPNVLQLNNRDQIELFCRTLFGDEDVYAHPKRKNVMVIDGEEYENVDTEGYEIFSSRYDSNEYSLKEYQAITSMADTLITEANRRFKGDYYTPKIWADKAHEYISYILGDNWKDEYVVYNPASGTKNLTSNYKFSNLYSSTLHDGEIMSTQHFNKDNIAFQYDFLNDDMCLHDGTLTREDLLKMTDNEIENTLKMDLSLVKKLLNKEKLVFLGNPPYGQATTGQTNDHKAGTANTAIGELMRKKKLGHASGELYTQFYYRVQLLKNFFEYGEDETDQFHIFFFSSAKFLPSPSFGKFVDSFTKDFSFGNGFLLNAGEFSGTSTSWGIIFSHWSLEGEKSQKEFHFDVLGSDPSGEIKKITDWTAKRVSKDNTISSWMMNKYKKKRIKDEKCPVTRNGFDAPDTKVWGNVYDGWFGYYLNVSSNVQKSEKDTALFSTNLAMGHGCDITEDNFERALVSFSIRRAVYESLSKQKTLWYRWEDMFTSPSDNLLTDEFIADCVVYSLFDFKSRQTSLRNYDYNDNVYRVENEFFPFSMKFIEDLAIQYKNVEIQADIIGEKERFVCKWLKDHEKNISHEASELLNKAEELYRQTFKYRNEYAMKMPRYQTNSWDAGYVQIARMAFGNDRINDDFMKFKNQFYSTRDALGEKIAQAAFNDGVI